MNEQCQPGAIRQMTEAEMKEYNAKMEAGTARLKQEAADPWRHRSAGMRCQTCMWFVRKEPTGLVGSIKSAEVGRCRRHAPTMNGYPVVYMTDWCGDHRIDENKL